VVTVVEVVAAVATRTVIVHRATTANQGGNYVAQVVNLRRFSFSTKGKSQTALVRPVRLLPFVFPAYCSLPTAYYLFIGVIFKVSLSLPRMTSTWYSCPAFISPSA